MFAFGSACKGERRECGQGCRGVGRQLRWAGGLKAEVLGRAESLFWEAAEPLKHLQVILGARSQNWLSIRLSVDL